MATLPRAAVALAAAAIAAAAHAHEFWLLPSAFRCDTDTLIRVEMFHGERFAGEIVARNTPQIARYELLQNGRSTPVRGLHAHTSGLLRPESPGPGIIVYESNEYPHTMEGPRFEAYLQEEGLTAISAWRRDNGRTDETGREAYVRCAKALVAVGDASVTPEDHPVGLPLEIVVDDAATDSVNATLLFEGRPLEGARVVAVCADSPSSLIELESDVNGEVSFDPPTPGDWMLTSLHMVHETEREDIDWKSYWASNTFEIDPARDPG